eukprot:CAMPEP_0113562052 /NCGR_PEP_ID=MMETSP0015_2-20120614/20316_1 /TAXON_ID=2838 /ORGANISM="Odontella" /LENGTH=82 /DNA_ID=CAMNT_0000463913 /DNA_START=234 /DNA_END=478 /DNA_ORIENTATION=- /assembly_acc=CAM_ASM_000160
MHGIISLHFTQGKGSWYALSPGLSDSCMRRSSLFDRPSTLASNLATLVDRTTTSDAEPAVDAAFPARTLPAMADDVAAPPPP